MNKAHRTNLTGVQTERAGNDRAAASPDLSKHEIIEAIAIDAAASTIALSGMSGLILPRLRQGVPVKVADLRCHLAPSMSLLEMARNAKSERTLTSTTIFRCVDYYSSLKSAITAVGSAPLQGDAERRGTAFSAAASLWQNAMGAGVRMLDEIRHEAGAEVSRATAQALTAASAALSSARAAEMAAADGEKSAYDNLRQSKRFTLNTPATLQLGSRRYRIVVIDVSSGGMGVAGVVNAHPGDRAVCILNGRDYAGKIMWVSGNNAGFKFDAAADINGILGSKF